MTNPSSLTTDLAFVRDMAEAGHNAPLLGGRFLAWWGGLATLAYLGHYAVISGLGGVGPLALWWLWGGFMVLGLGGQMLMGVRMPAKPGAASAGNLVQQTYFMVAGFALFAYFAGVIGRVLVTGEGLDGFSWSVPMVLGLYGIGQILTGRLTRQAPLVFAGAAALVCVAVASFLSGSELIWLVGAGAALFAVCVPGLMMLRREPGTTV